MSAFLPLAHGAEDLFEDFEGPDYGKWRAEGNAFGARPAVGPINGQQPVTGFSGKGFVNTFLPDDDARGKLISPTFRVEQPFISFLIGGGDHEGRACINLIVNGRVVRTATGAAAERLEPSGWDVRDLLGKDARLEIVDDVTGQWGHINVDRIEFTSRPVPVVQTNASRELVASGPWVNFPVKTGAKKRVVTVKVDGRDVRRFDIELADGEPDWWAPLDVREWRGKKLTVTVDRLGSESKALANITGGDRVPGTENLYAEKLRPQFHFSARRGWLNDPNGLVYYNGEYHLFFQHNPYGYGWGNMHWGHAVSSDLVHWRELGEALYPDELGTMYSGSAVVDEKNTSGFGKPGQPAMVLFYTAAGNPFTQAMAYSTDGRTFQKFKGNPVVPNISRENRDPKVYWHEPTRQWVMAFWGEDNGHALFFLTSPDLKKWTRTSTLKGGPGGFLFECPDYFELPIDGNPKETSWVVFGADGTYGLGHFDGKKFTLTGKPQRALAGDSMYAAQTYANEPNGRRILIGWFRADSPGMPFNQAMTIPLDLGLRRTPAGVRLTYQPAKELTSLRQTPHEIPAFALKAGETKTFTGIAGDLLEIRAVFRPDPASVVTFDVHGVAIRYDTRKQELSVSGRTIPARLRDGAVDLTIYLDRTTLEVFAAGGEAFVPVATTETLGKTNLAASAEGAGANFTKLDIFELRSAWKPAAKSAGSPASQP